MKTTLDQLQPGSSGTISCIRGSGVLKRRIIDMGLVADNRIVVQKHAPLGDPIEIKVKNFNLALRKSEAAMIEVTL